MRKFLLLALLALFAFGALASESFSASPEGDEEAQVQEIVYEGMTSEETAKLRESAKTFEFQAEVSRMMKLIVNSLYKNKEIFLRELISNGSDALDKIRFIALTSAQGLGENTELKMQIKADRDANTLTIRDTGVGMTQEDLIKNLGTIAKSGTSEFLAASEQGGDMGLIGQFGVGFYSAFLVADTVTVVSKNDNDEQFIWESNSEGAFSIVKDPRGNTLGRGTSITLHLKEEAQEYLNPTTLENLVQKYSEFINFPIYLFTTRVEEREVPDEDAEAEAAEPKEGEDGEVEEVDEDIEAEPKTKTIKETIEEYKQVNHNKPIWTRSAEEVTAEEYEEFYKAFSKDSQGPLGYVHFKAEGEVEFRSMLFVPPKAPNNLYSSDEAPDNIKLFVRRVFITDTDVETMLPKYLKFLKGIVDSDDLPLNISRETLQQHKMLKVIKRKLTRKALDMFRKMSVEDPEKYDEFLQEYGTSLKLGVIEDASNRKRLSKLLRFSSSNSDAQTSLEAYVERMKQGQETIFFLAGTSIEDCTSSPFLERLLARGYEVLYLTDPIDEYTFQSLTDYEGLKFQNIAKEGLTFGDEDADEEAKLESQTEEFQPLIDWMSETLASELDKVVISNRLTTSPVALVAQQYGWSGNMERIMKAQAYAQNSDPMASYYANMKKILEINPNHPVIQGLLKVIEAEAADETTVSLAQILVDTATLRGGYGLKDSNAFASRIESVLRANLGVDPNVQVQVNEKPALDKVTEEEEEEIEEVTGDRDEL